MLIARTLSVIFCDRKAGPCEACPVTKSVVGEWKRPYQSASKDPMGTIIGRQLNTRICYADAVVPALFRLIF
jgi:hypothetical protein